MQSSLVVVLPDLSGILSVLMFTPPPPPSSHLSLHQMSEVQLGQESLAESARSCDLFHYCLFGDLQQS